MQNNRLAVRIWDLPTRLFHWALVVCIVGAFVSVKLGGLYMDWHVRFGCTALGLILFRLLWGFAGPRYARFAHFVRGPGAVVRYLKGAAAPAGHWWNELREVGADGFTTTDGGFERFVFYDGEVRFRPLFRFTRGATATATTRRPAPERGRDAPPDPSVEPTIAPTRAAEGPLFVVRGGTYVEHDRVDGRWSEVGRGAASTMRARLRPALLARGLDEAESDSLLDVWTDELFGDGEHAVYFVPRAVYDRMLPMRITARPTLIEPDGPTRAEVRLVRVGVVIERL